MLPRQSKLIKILQTELEKYKSFTNKYQKTKSLKESNNELIIKLKEDINNITNIEDKEIVELIEAFDLNALEKKNLTNNILISRKILLMNQKEGLNISLEESQRQSISNFISYIETLNLVREKTIPIDEPEYNDNVQKINDIEKIISLLEDKNNETRITNINTIKDILSKTNLDCQRKRKRQKKHLLSRLKQRQCMTPFMLS